MDPFERGRHGKLLTEAERRSRSGVVWPQGSTASDAVYPLLHEIAPQPPEGVVYPLLSELNPQPSSDVVYPLLSELNPQPSSDVVYPLLHELRPQPPDDVVYLQIPNESRRWPSPVAFPIVQANGMVGVPGWSGGAGQPGSTELERQHQQQMRPDVAGGFPEDPIIPGHPVQKQSMIDLAQHTSNSSFLENTLTDKSGKYLCDSSSDDVKSSLTTSPPQTKPLIFPNFAHDEHVAMPHVEQPFFTEPEQQYALYPIPQVLPRFSSVHTFDGPSFLPFVQEGTGIPQFVPSFDAQSLRSWLSSFFQKNPLIQREIKWQGIATRSWDAVTYDVSNQNSMQHEAWQEVISYMWTIEKLYEYYGLIRNNHHTMYANTHPPSLDLPYSITDENRRVNEVYARRLFLAYLAHSLVLEKHRLVPWSLTDYTTNNNLAYLLRSDTFYGDKNAEDEDGFIGRVSPSDPTVPFLWMVYQGWISVPIKSSPQLNNNERMEIRDNILRWCGSMIQHTTSLAEQAERASGYPTLFKKDGTPYRGQDYFYFGYWGTVRLPPLIRIIAGHCVAYNSFYMKSSDESSPSKESLPQFIYRAAPYRIPQSFSMRAYQGCWAASRFLTYLFRIINIPAYFAEFAFMERHSTFILPAEPHPHKPDPWILLHSDDLFGASASPVNPLHPGPMERLFWSWSDFIQNMTNPAEHFPLPRNLFPQDPRKFRLPSSEPYNSRYHEIFDRIHNKDLFFLQKEYPTLNTIVGACALYGLLDSPIIYYNSFYYGPYTGFVYYDTDLFYRLSPSDLGKNMPLNLSFREKQIWTLASDLGQMIFLLSKAQQKTGSTNARTNAEYYWSLYDLLQYRKYMTHSYPNPTLNKNFKLHCT